MQCCDLADQLLELSQCMSLQQNPCPHLKNWTFEIKNDQSNIILYNSSRDHFNYSETIFQLTGKQFKYKTPLQQNGVCITLVLEIVSLFKTNSTETTFSIWATIEVPK